MKRSVSELTEGESSTQQPVEREHLLDDLLAVHVLGPSDSDSDRWGLTLRKPKAPAVGGSKCGMPSVSPCYIASALWIWH